MITHEKIQEVKECLDKGHSQRKTALLCNVSCGTVRNIKYNKIKRSVEPVEPVALKVPIRCNICRCLINITPCIACNGGI